MKGSLKKQSGSSKQDPKANGESKSSKENGEGEFRVQPMIRHRCTCSVSNRNKTTGSNLTIKPGI